MGKFPARLHVLFRPETPLAVIIRRGPSKTVCTLGWDRRDDSISLGQWMRARIYERRSDISSDGKYMIYLAMNGRWTSSVKGSWTAISRTPYLKAITLWPKGDCWQGGGLFTDQHTFWLNGCHDAPLPTPEGPARGMAKELRQTETFPGIAHYNAECLGIYYNRLQRDGWELVESSHDQYLTVFHKAAGAGWILRKYAYASVKHPEGRGVYYDEHDLYHPATRESLIYPEWEWAEVDGSRLVWAEAGKLCAGRLTAQGLESTILADFNEMAFEPLTAPY